MTGEQAGSIQSVMFADICNSTSLYEQLGNTEALSRVAARMESMVRVVQRNHGIVVKSLGDGILSVFGSADDALDAALTMHRLTDLLPIKVGVHTGEVLNDDTGDVFGDAVNVSARISDLAKPRETLISDEVRASLMRPAPTMHPLGTRRVKGRSLPVTLFSVTAETEFTVMQTMFELGQEETAQPILTLDYCGQVTLEIGAFNPQITIGRSETCDLVVDCRRTSREHATISWYDGIFRVQDMSRNGTFITQSGQELKLMRQSADLVGNGQLSFGAAVGEMPEAVVYFAIAKSF